ncbi:MAG: hypothetical protein ACLSWB_02070 [Clostridia bacterium]
MSLKQVFHQIMKIEFTNRNCKNETIVTTAIGIGVLAISLISIRIYLSKFVIYPINRLIKVQRKLPIQKIIKIK